MNTNKKYIRALAISLIVLVACIVMFQNCADIRVKRTDKDLPLTEHTPRDIIDGGEETTTTRVPNTTTTTSSSGGAPCAEGTCLNGGGVFNSSSLGVCQNSGQQAGSTHTLRWIPSVNGSGVFLGGMRLNSTGSPCYSDSGQYSMYLFGGVFGYSVTSKGFFGNVVSDTGITEYQNHGSEMVENVLTDIYPFPSLGSNYVIAVNGPSVIGGINSSEMPVGPILYAIDNHGTGADRLRAVKSGGFQGTYAEFLDHGTAYGAGVVVGNYFVAVGFKSLNGSEAGSFTGIYTVSPTSGFQEIGRITKSTAGGEEFMYAPLAGFSSEGNDYIIASYKPQADYYRVGLFRKPQQVNGVWSFGEPLLVLHEGSGGTGMASPMNTSYSVSPDNKKFGFCQSGNCKIFDILPSGLGPNPYVLDRTRVPNKGSQCASNTCSEMKIFVGNNHVGVYTVNGWDYLLMKRSDYSTITHERIPPTGQTNPGNKPCSASTYTGPGTCDVSFGYATVNNGMNGIGISPQGKVVVLWGHQMPWIYEFQIF